MSKELSKKELRELLNEQGYSIEALEDEVDELKWANRDLCQMVLDKQTRIVELISENDRLTMTYEPYRPPGDEDENISYYDLKEENQHLVTDVRLLNDRIGRLYADLTRSTEVTKPKKYPKAGVVSFDFWPLSDWFRLTLHRWNPGQSFQLCIGPIRVDWFTS